MPTIYRKYRPQRFSDVTGQDHITKTIANEIATGKIAHAYLFSGPRGIGKTTLARLLAKSINCLNRKEGQFEPCNECISCTEITAGHSIDIMEIDAASNTGVDNVRENIIENAQFKPTKSRYKVFIIDEVHMLSTSAFNALLKTLEEPPMHVIFILATTEQHKLPATIISRCQRFNFKKVGFDPMLARLKNICKEEGVKVDDKVLERVINKSDGCMRDAESLLGQILSINLKNIGPEEAEMILPTSNVQTVIDFIEQIINKKTQEAIALIGQLVSDGINLEQFSYDVIELLRVIMILQSDMNAKVVTDYNEDNIKIIKKLSAQIEAGKLIKLIEALMARRREIRIAPIPQLPLELFIVNFTASEIEQNTPTQKISESPKQVEPTQTSDENKSEEKKHHHIAQTIKDTISTITSHKQPIKCTVEDIKAKWDEIVKKVAEENHSLSFILKMCSLENIDENGLRVTVPYSFHKDKLEESKARKIIDKFLSECLGEKIYMRCDVVPVATVETNDEGLNELAANFGGEVLD